MSETDAEVGAVGVSQAVKSDDLVTVLGSERAESLDLQDVTTGKGLFQVEYGACDLLQSWGL